MSRFGVLDQKTFSREIPLWKNYLLVDSFIP